MGGWLCTQILAGMCFGSGSSALGVVVASALISPTTLTTCHTLFLSVHPLTVSCIGKVFLKGPWPLYFTLTGIAVAAFRLSFQDKDHTR